MRVTIVLQDQDKMRLKEALYDDAFWPDGTQDWYLTHVNGSVALVVNQKEDSYYGYIRFAGHDGSDSYLLKTTEGFYVEEEAKREVVEMYKALVQGEKFPYKEDLRESSDFVEIDL